MRLIKRDYGIPDKPQQLVVRITITWKASSEEIWLCTHLSLKKTVLLRLRIFWSLFRPSTFAFRPSAFAFRPSAFAFRPSMFQFRPSTFAFRTSVFTVVAEFWISDGKERGISFKDEYFIHRCLSCLLPSCTCYEHGIDSACRVTIILDFNVLLLHGLSLWYSQLNLVLRCDPRTHHCLSHYAHSSLISEHISQALLLCFMWCNCETAYAQRIGPNKNFTASQ